MVLRQPQNRSEHLELARRWINHVDRSMERITTRTITADSLSLVSDLHQAGKAMLAYLESLDTTLTFLESKALEVESPTVPKLHTRPKRPDMSKIYGTDKCAGVRPDCFGEYTSQPKAECDACAPDVADECLERYTAREEEQRARGTKPVVELVSVQDDPVVHDAPDPEPDRFTCPNCDQVMDFYPSESVPCSECGGFFRGYVAGDPPPVVRVQDLVCHVCKVVFTMSHHKEGDKCPGCGKGKLVWTGYPLLPSSESVDIGHDPNDFCKCGHRRRTHNGPGGSCIAARGLCRCTKFELCPTCDGKGHHPDPTCAEDPRHRVGCFTCGGLAESAPEPDDSDLCKCNHVRGLHTECVGRGRVGACIATGYEGDECTCTGFELETAAVDRPDLGGVDPAKPGTERTVKREMTRGDFEGYEARDAERVVGLVTHHHPTTIGPTESAQYRDALTQSTPFDGKHAHATPAGLTTWENDGPKHTHLIELMSGDRHTGTMIPGPPGRTSDPRDLCTCGHFRQDHREPSGECEKCYVSHDKEADRCKQFVLAATKDEATK